MPYAPYVGLVALGAVALWNLNRRDDLRARAIFVAFGAAAVALMTFQSTGRGTPFGDFDKAYYPAGEAVLAAPGRLYECAHPDGLCFVNPPVIALLFAPVATLPRPAAHAVVMAGSIAAIALATWLLIDLCEAIGVQRFAIIALVLLDGPLYYSVRLGNLTHVVLVLVLIAVGWLIRGLHGRAGALLACSALLKPPLLIWLPYFALRRQRRAGVVMAATLAACGGLSVALFGLALNLSWAKQFVVGSSAHPIGAYNVQSIAGFLIRLTTSGTLVTWQPVPVSRLVYLAQIALTLAVTGLALVSGAAAGAPRTKAAQLREYGMLLCVMLLVSPVSWTHYYCLLLLPLAGYAAGTLAVPSTGWWRWSMAGAALLIALPVMLWVPPGFTGAVVGRVLLSHYVFGAVLLLITFAAASLRVRATTAGDPIAYEPLMTAPAHTDAMHAPMLIEPTADLPDAARTGGATPRPDVSIVVSTFNRCDSLCRTLDSLIAQDVPRDLRYEIIVVDNNSSDQTAARVAPYLRHPKVRIRYVFERRQGVSYGRNAGIAASEAPIVAFTDDDIEVDRRWVATIKATLDASPDVAAVGGRVLPESAQPALPQWLNEQHWGPLAILDYGDDRFETSRSNPRCLLTANLAVRREVFARIGGFSPAFQRCQDHELLIRLWRGGSCALYAPDLVVRSRITEERLTRRYHRQWHAQHGRYAALMQLQEIIDASGKLVDSPQEAIRLYGTPGFVYRDLMVEVIRWISALGRGDRTHIAHQYQIHYLVAYIRRAGATARRSWLQCLTEPYAFAAAHVRRCAAMASMSFGRLLVGICVIAAAAAGAAYDLATDREHWPFSPYAMFSTVAREPSVDALRVFGVTRGPDAREIPLLDPELIRPFDQRRLSTAFERTYHNPARRSQVVPMLGDVLTRYERLRAAGKHDGPPLQAVRLYDMHWTLDPAAANVSTPDRRQLLSEVRRSSSSADGDQ